MPKRLPTLLWAAQSENKKTGNIPTAHVGPNIQAARASCHGCPLLETRACYAHNGTPRMGAASVYRAAKGNAGRKRYTLAHALEHAHKGARHVRVTAIGDPARTDRKTLRNALKTARAAGKGILGYTHFWREHNARGLRSELMASCDTLSLADVAISRGWIPAAIAPGATEADTWVTTPNGARLLVCPAQRRPGVVTCNACGLCNVRNKAWQTGRVDGIAPVDRRPGPLSLPKGNGILSSFG